MPPMLRRFLLAVRMTDVNKNKLQIVRAYCTDGSP